MKTARRYRMNRRAESQARTRARIVEAAMGLHEERGVKTTTISDIAERAGVERLTVYRHFPDELSLLRACSGHWAERNPAPDPTAWSAIGDRVSRTQLALTALYAYYRRTEAMWNSILKDEPDVPAIQIVMEGLYRYLNAMAEDLDGAWQQGRKRREKLAVAVSHSVQFYTWQSFRRQGMSDEDTAQLMILWFEALRSAERLRKKRTGD